MTTAAIQIDGLTKSYGDVVALDHLDLSVPKGSIFGFLGPNGAGKSTTIRMLIGSVRPSSGSATVHGFDVVADRTRVHHVVGYLAGDFVAYRNLTGRQYLTYLARLRTGVQSAETERLAARFDLDLDRRIGALSHGNRQKVGIVQAFMHRPDLLILDEPTQGLDPLVQNVFLELLREHRSAGGTTFLSSHVLSEVEEVADTVAIIRDGRLSAVSDIDELKRRTRRRVELTFAGPQRPTVEQLRSTPNVAEAEAAGDRVLQTVVEGSMAEMLKLVAPFEVERIVADEVDLQGVLLHYYEDR